MFGYANSDRIEFCWTRFLVISKSLNAKPFSYQPQRQTRYTDYNITILMKMEWKCQLALERSLSLGKVYYHCSLLLCPRLSTPETWWRGERGRVWKVIARRIMRRLEFFNPSGKCASWWWFWLNSWVSRSSCFRVMHEMMRRVVDWLGGLWRLKDIIIFKYATRTRHSDESQLGKKESLQTFGKSKLLATQRCGIIIISRSSSGDEKDMSSRLVQIHDSSTDD